MKILTKFRISNAIDSRRPWSESIKMAVATSPELRAFAERSEALDKVLRHPPYPPADASLHRSIMNAVRAQAEAPWPKKAHVGLWLAPAAALLVLAAMGWWLAGTRAPQPVSQMAFVASSSPLETVSAAIEMGGQMSRRMPTAMIAPLSNEWAQVDSDLRGATKIIVDSMP